MAGLGSTTGAVYSPELEIVPVTAVPPVAPSTCQVTAVLLAPLTLAVNCWLVPVASEVEVGESEIDSVSGALTLTLADADLLVSTTLVAVTM
ncbi:MAG TPA: hypothetical protein VIL63_04465 [Terriglobales bacterium]